METITQGQQEKDNSGIVQFDPNTGARLSSGQTVTIKPVKPISPSISTDQIGTAPLNIRPQQPTTETTGTSEFITGTTSDYKTQREKEIAQREQTNEDYMSQINDVFSEQAGLGQKEEDILREEGADDAKKQADEYASQIEAEQVALRRKTEKLIKENPQGVSRDAMNANIYNIERDSLSKQADLAILQNAAVRKYDTAKAIADRKIAMETESLKNRMESLQFFYQDNKEQLTKKQDQAYQEAIKQADREYNEQYEQKQKVEGLKLELLKNGAPTSLVEGMSGETDITKILTTPGVNTYLRSPLERMQEAKYSLDYKKAKKEFDDIMATSGAESLTESERQDLLKNPVAQQAGARIGVIRSLQNYKEELADRTKNGLLSRADRIFLNNMVKSTIGSAINVAQGQGAMGEDEAKRILRDLLVSGFKNPDIAKQAASATINAQDTLYYTNLEFVESAIPGASTGFQLFADYEASKTDPLLVNKTDSTKDRLRILR